MLCEAHHAPALLTPAGLAREHTRYVRHLLEVLGNCMDAFTGAMLDLKKQTATVQYKVGSERDALLNSTERTDFEDVDANILQRQRRGSMVQEIRSGAIDGSHMLDDVTGMGSGWNQGCYTGQRCVLVLGPAASGKTTLLRRFVVEAVEKPGQIVPILPPSLTLCAWLDGVPQ